MAEVARADRPRKRVSWHLPRLRRQRLAPVLVLSGVVAVAAALAVALTLRGGAANPSSAAAAVLQRAAHAAAAAGGPWQLRPGEYWYVKSVETTAGAQVADPSVRGGIRVIVNALTSTQRQAWISVDRPGLDVRRITQPITFLSAAARQQWIRDGRPHQVPLRTRWQVPPDAFYLPYRQLLALPSNADALWRMFQRHAGNGSSTSRHAEMFTEIGDLLREQPIPPKVRAAIYVAAMVADLVASTLRIAPTVVGAALDATVDHLRRRQALLVLDNCEHVLTGVAGFVDQLADADARCAVLLTSREAVGIPGEVIWTLGPLALDASTAGEQSPAVELLLARLRVVRRSMSTTPSARRPWRSAPPSTAYRSRSSSPPHGYAPTGSQPSSTRSRSTQPAAPARPGARQPPRQPRSSHRVELPPAVPGRAARPPPALGAPRPVHRGRRARGRRARARDARALSGGRRRAGPARVPRAPLAPRAGAARHDGRPATVPPARDGEVARPAGAGGRRGGLHAEDALDAWVRRPGGTRPRPFGPTAGGTTASTTTTTPSAGRCTDCWSRIRSPPGWASSPGSPATGTSGADSSRVELARAPAPSPTPTRSTPPTCSAPSQSASCSRAAPTSRSRTWSGPAAAWRSTCPSTSSAPWPGPWPDSRTPCSPAPSAHWSAITDEVRGVASHRRHRPPRRHALSATAASPPDPTSRRSTCAPWSRARRSPR